MLPPRVCCIQPCNGFYNTFKTYTVITQFVISDLQGFLYYFRYKDTPNTHPHTFEFYDTTKNMHRTQTHVIIKFVKRSYVGTDLHMGMGHMREGYS